MDMKKCLEYLQEYSEQLELVALNLFHEIQSQSKTYGELQRNIDLLKKDIMWNKQDCEVLIKKLDEYMEKEIGDLPITNRHE